MTSDKLLRDVGQRFWPHNYYNCINIHIIFGGGRGGGGGWVKGGRGEEQAVEAGAEAHGEQMASNADLTRGVAGGMSGVAATCRQSTSFIRARVRNGAALPDEAPRSRLHEAADTRAWSCCIVLAARACSLSVGTRRQREGTNQTLVLLRERLRALAARGAREIDARRVESVAEKLVQSRTIDERRAARIECVWQPDSQLGRVPCPIEDIFELVLTLRLGEQPDTCVAVEPVLRGRSHGVKQA
ncbi:hypothetical protein T492DRAFT_834703 [Pavlovales sp. CCMP2436]|nr:hypothetical protein T492DRAFT_834703 [Pavlovales sp. CCMP2436]